ncbi:MAG: quinoprotein dehydrogenase-associated SoxYZ-like carrier [Alphaproteobacteria bacterium]|nr:quinoprotein dehydrogenase-associated SoxYZ-like carrier [Alphaproteobacteria bacterium]
MVPVLGGLLAFCASLTHAHAGAPADPLNSVMWEELSQHYFGSSPVVFDSKVRVTVPSLVENQAQVPVTADARELGVVKKLIVFADLNPIVHVLTLSPRKAKPYISFRMKVEQGTPVRAAALTEDGVWHVGGVFLDAAGGGCSAPAMARQMADWSETVGQTQAKLWRELDGSARVRLRMRHPMDTGLATDNTPAYYVETLQVRAEGGDALAELELREPVSEDPTLTLMLRLPQSATAVDVEGRDNNGGIYRATVPAPWRQSQVLDRL